MNRLGTLSHNTSLSFLDDVAVSIGGETHTYCEIDRAAAQIAAGLLEHDVRANERIACFLENGHEVFEIVYGCFRISASVVFISPYFKVMEVLKILLDCRPRVLFTDGKLYESVVKELVPSLPFIDLYCLTNSAIDLPGKACSILDLKRAATTKSLTSLSCLHDANEGCVFYTSGSTGVAKGVAHGVDQLMNEIADHMGHFAFHRYDRVLFSEPLCGNAFPLTQAVLPAVSVGARIVLLPPHSSDAGGFTSTTIESTVQVLIDEQITCLVAGPFFLRSLLKHIERSQNSSKLHLRYCITSGDVVPQDTYDRFLSLCGFSICELYGSSEALGMALTPRDTRMGKGKYLPYGGTNFRILDESFNALPRGELGEIAVKSRTLMLGYVNDPVLTSEMFKDGWLRTGDMGYVDEDDYLRFTGRLKHIICYDGDNISPQEVESALLSHPRVVEACVVGIPSKTYGEKPVAYVVVTADGDQVNYNNLVDFLESKIAKYKIPAAVMGLPALPRTATRKMDRSFLSARALSDFRNEIAAEEI
jgi:long-chain acyl-CoA synthetase